MSNLELAQSLALDFIIMMLSLSLGFPGGTSGKELACQCRRPKRCGFDPWIRNIPWRSKWQPTPGFLPGKSQRQRSPVGYSPRGCKRESDMTEATKQKNQSLMADHLQGILLLPAFKKFCFLN